MKIKFRNKKKLIFNFNLIYFNLFIISILWMAIELQKYFFTILSIHKIDGSQKY